MTLNSLLGGITSLPRPIKTLILFLIDAVLACIACLMATVARFGRIPDLPLETILLATAVAAVPVPILALTFGLYRSMTRYLSPHFPARAGIVSLTAGSILALIGLVGGARPLQTLSLGFIFALGVFVLLLTSRAIARRIIRGPGVAGQSVAIYGAGAAGRQLAAMLARDDSLRPVAFIDDDAKLWGRSIEDLPVLNPRDSRFRERLNTRGVREVLIAIPSLKPSRRRQMLEFLSSVSMRVRSVPSLGDLLNRRAEGIGELVEVTVEDLLGRDPVTPLPGLLESCIRSKTVLVTGGGGSIGSELCRQAIKMGPRKLLVLDHSELALYQVEQDLRRTAAAAGDSTQLEFVLGSVTDAIALGHLFAKGSIDTVYHAAAYKHVPIVESNPIEGFRNNVFGTWYLARTALANQTSNFVLISTDKAVRPTSVMGASKRIAELVLEELASRAVKTKFAMVRFGNVLASSGSVVPLFRKQIAAGGPVTLTHPDVTRYFMTIPEAVELVIQAGAMATAGDLFVLEMGTPVRILDLAQRMIRLSGLSIRDEMNPNGDIAIEVTGLRPGEKLFEELLIEGEVTGTLHPRIMRMKERPLDTRQLEGDLARLESCARNEITEVVVRAFMSKWVAGYDSAPSTAGGASLRIVAAKSV